MECIILIGVPASGKSTCYHNLFNDTHLRISLDILGRRSRERAIFEAAVMTKTKIVIDNTNVTVKDRAKYIPLLKENNYKIRAIVFNPDLERAFKNNKKRTRKVPEEAIEGYAKRFVMPSHNEGFDNITISGWEDYGGGN